MVSASRSTRSSAFDPPAMRQDHRTRTPAGVERPPGTLNTPSTWLG
jgi:hypothetical protein